MDTKAYNVIIIGGGLAGLSAAATIAAKSDIHVAIIEGRSIGSNNPTPMTFVDVITRFGLEDCVTAHYRRFTFHSPLGNKSSHSYTAAPLVALDYRAACRLLLHRSQNAGNITVIESKAGKLQRTAKNHWHIQTVDKQSFNTPLVIDASGRGLFAAKQLNLPMPKMYSHCFGQIFNNCNVPDPEEVFFLAPTDSFGNGGGWLYPLADGRVSFGYATLGKTKVFPGATVKQRYYRALQEFAPYNKWLAESEPDHAEVGIIPVCPPKRFVYDGLMIIGDAAGQATIWSCMGSEPALVSGQLAGQAATVAYKKADYSTTTLNSYQQTWQQNYGKIYRQGTLLATPSWGQSEESWHSQIPLVQQLTPEQMVARLRSNWPQLAWWQIAFIVAYDWAGRMRRGLVAKIKNIPLMTSQLIKSVFFILTVICFTAILFGCISPETSQAVTTDNTVINVNWNNILGSGPTYYGVEYGWVDQDRDLFLERYRLLGANTLRVQITQEFLEMQNDNDDPAQSDIDFNVTFPYDIDQGKTITYRDMFSTLAAEFPEMHFHINIWLAARWNATDPNGYLGLGGAFPPLDYAEHQEFVRELAHWLVNTCDIAPHRLSFSFINEPNLTPFFVGNQADLQRMAIETRIALNQVSPQIKMMGLDEVHGTSWTDDFYNQQPSDCCDAWIIHAYENGTENLWHALQTRINHLTNYGPVWVTEFADMSNGSPDSQMDFSSQEAALGFATVAGKLWSTDVDGIIHFRLGDTYLDHFDSWAGHGLFADWRGTKSNGEPYALYPAFWVFSNLYHFLGGGQIVQTTTPSNLVVTGVRKDDSTLNGLAIWLTNPETATYTTTVEIANFPHKEAQVEIIDNLGGNTPEKTFTAQGSPLVFELAVLPQSSQTILVSNADIAQNSPSCSNKYQVN